MTNTIHKPVKGEEDMRELINGTDTGRVDAWLFVIFYYAVVRTAILFRSDAWVFSEHIISVLEGAHDRFAKGIRKIIPKQNR